MAESTIFANRATANVVTGQSLGDSSATFGTGTTITLVGTGSYTSDDYVYNFTNDSHFNLSKVSSYNSGTDTITLEYAYDGTAGSGKALYVGELTTVAVLKGLEVTVNYEIETLYGLDSTVRQDEAKHTTDIEVKVNFAKFDSNPSNDWVMDILNPSGGDGTVSDTFDMYIPTLILVVKDSTAQYQEILLKDTYFESVPMPASENDFITRELTGHASDIKFRSY